MWDWISKWLEDKVLGFIADKIGIDKNTLKSWADTLWGFLREIIGVFDSDREALEWMRQMHRAMKVSKVSKQDRKRLLEKMIREL